MSKVSPKQLKDGISSNALIKFNITKDGTAREAVCTAQFEEADIIPMIDGLLSRLHTNQTCLTKIRAVMNNKADSDAEKIEAIQALLSPL